MGNLSINEIRAKLLLSRPYFGVAAMNLKPVETPGIGTFAVDKHWRLYYDPAVILEWSNEECASVMEHELMHVLRSHSDRQQGREHKRWNVAADCEINDDIQGLPKGCMYPSVFGLEDSETAEFYYDKLPEPPEHPDCGSGAGGDKRPWEQEGKGVSGLEADAIRKQTAEAIRNAGNAPGGLKRWADEVLTPPKIHWSRILPSAVRLAVVQGTPQRFRYPARRESEFILPRMISGKPSAALVVDTSGSITDKDLALAIALIKQALQQAELAIYACDTECVRVERLSDGFVGGGGTNMMNGVSAALAGRPKPAAVVIITDCYSPWDAEAPKVPVVILTSNPDQAPRSAKVITI